MDDALRFLEVYLLVLWVALAIAIAVFVVALLSKGLGPVVAWLEVRALPRLARRTRVAHGLAPDAPRWACRACHSVNEPTAVGCYHCGAPTGEAAEPLPDRSGSDLWQPPPPASRFDASLYRGPGPPEAATQARPAGPLERHDAR